MMDLIGIFYLAGGVLNLICILLVFSCTDKEGKCIMTWGRLIRMIFVASIPVFNLFVFAVEMGLCMGRISVGEWKLRGKIPHLTSRFFNSINKFLKTPILK